MNCKICGSQLVQGARVCPICGTPITSEVNNAGAVQTTFPASYNVSQETQPAPYAVNPYANTPSSPSYNPYNVTPPPPPPVYNPYSPGPGGVPFIAPPPSRETRKKSGWLIAGTALVLVLLIGAIIIGVQDNTNSTGQIGIYVYGLSSCDVAASDARVWSF